MNTLNSAWQLPIERGSTKMGKKAPRIISASQLELLRTCPRKWYLAHILKVRTPVKSDLEVGKFIHDSIAKYHTIGCSIKDLEADILTYPTLSAEVRDLALGMVKNYIDYDQRNPLITPDVQEVIVERDFEDVCLVHKGVTLKWKPDMLLVKKGEVAIVEHKTSSNDWDSYDFLMRPQMRIYIMAASHEFTGKKCTGLFNVLYKRVPRMPEITKLGKVSKAACVTTREMYIEAIRSTDGKIDDYIDFLSKLPNYVFVERYPVDTVRPKDTLKFIAQQVDTMNHIIDVGLPYGTETFVCKQCPYKEICASGGDNEAKLEDAIKYYKQDHQVEG